MLLEWKNSTKLNVEIRSDTAFFASCNISKLAKDRKQLRMEYFYRMMRIKYNILIDNGKPEGGNGIHQQNRKPQKMHAYSKTFPLSPIKPLKY